MTTQASIPRLKSEEVAEFEYRPTKCKKSYRMIVVRKNISKEKGHRHLFDTIRYFFYITNGSGVFLQRALQP